MCKGINEHGEETDLIFISKLSRNGDVEWRREEDESKILSKTVSMSQMTSMLHDTDRNNVYEKAIQKSIEYFQHAYDRRPIVLDIGEYSLYSPFTLSSHGF